MKMDFDVVIIGAGPSGAAAGALLIDQGFSVVCLEKGFSPRFSIRGKFTTPLHGVFK
ncbi:MAG: FAD-dependent monooxygenase [Rheinheimera sp.]|nr:FAD-dependent monooxygenase [Rheinheimera sp.]